ncbi:hypothetical protein R1sor_019716 [Riccia sorocarpa]|uniref:Serine aminopeptidase S33 domain-containing protein n=1 Tax=Riccia sorocarpa TaxID=122646 RepID=A0ABD3IF05_9MARC
MVVSVEAASNAIQASQGKWGLISYITEAVIILLITVLLLQLRFSSFLPRVGSVILANSWAILGAFAFESSKKVVGTKKSEAAQGAILEPETPSLDWEAGRRETRARYRAKINQILGICPDEEVRGLLVREAFEVNSRGYEIFTKSWVLESGTPKASICLCHGYGDTCTFFFERIARTLAFRGFAVFAMDYVGFGMSAGLHGYIPKFDLLVEDVIEHYSSVKENEEFSNLPQFVLGESMGGAVALKAHLRAPTLFDGAVLVAPMCKIAAEMYPPWYLIEALKLMAKVIPKAKLVPSGDIAEIGFRDLEKRAQAMQNMIAYAGKPRLGTALSLLQATDEIEKDLCKISLPLLILHGAADRVTDPAVSKALYEKACTSDKTLRLYESAWHAVLQGEPDEMFDQAIDDIVRWLDTRSVQHQ